MMLMPFAQGGHPPGRAAGHGGEEAQLEPLARGLSAATDHRDVVLGVDLHKPDDAVIDFAFDAASRRALARLCRETYRARNASAASPAAAAAAESEPAIAQTPETLLVEQEAGAAALSFVPVLTDLPIVDSASQELAEPAPEAFSLGAFAVDPSAATHPLAELAATLPPAAAAFASDAGEAVHFHGYDIEKPVTPGTPLRIPFTANLPGRFELELHHPDVVLAVIEVRP